MKSSNRKHYRILSLILAIAILYTVPVLAQPGFSDGPRPHARPGGMQRGQMGPAQFGGQFQARKEQFLKQLNLSPEQKTALKEFRKSREDVRIELQRLKLERMELLRLLKDPKATENEVMKKVDRLNNMLVELNRARAQNFLKLKSQLSEEQLEKIVSALQQVKQRMRERLSQRFRGGGPGGAGPGDPGRGPRPGGEENDSLEMDAEVMLPGFGGQ